MQKPRLRPDDLRHMGQEGDNVVLYLALNLIDALDVKHCIASLCPDGRCRICRNDAQLRHLIGGVSLDLEHDTKTGLGVPDLGEGGTGIARDHERGCTPPSYLSQDQSASPRSARALASAFTSPNEPNR